MNHNYPKSDENEIQQASNMRFSSDCAPQPLPTGVYFNTDDVPQNGDEKDKDHRINGKVAPIKKPRRQIHSTYAPLEKLCYDSHRGI